MTLRSSFTSLAVVVAAFIGCGSDDTGSGYPSVKVKDQLGRSCTIGEHEDATCDQDPKPSGACKTTATACFMVGTTGDASGPAAICAGCCEGNTSTSVRTDCAKIVCSAATDCPSTYGRCLNGECRH